MIIDTHAHVNFNAFKKDADEVIHRSLDEGVHIINVGSDYPTSKRAVELAEKYDTGVYAAIGLHPIHVNDEEFNYEKYKELAKSEKVIAVGETGLDYYLHYKDFQEKQHLTFKDHLKLARELNLPVIFHCRMAHEDLFNIITNENGAVHCFTGNWEQAKKYLNKGLYLGINGIIYKRDLKEVIEKTPLDRLLIETDCPYLTPPKAGAERNEPRFVKHISQEIAEIKKEPLSKVVQTTFSNAQKLFNIVG